MAITLARASVAQRSQLALESSYGDAPGSPAWKRLPTLMIKPKPDVDSKTHREQGRKFSSIVIPNKEWSTASFEGALTYGEIPFIYSSLFALPPGYPFTAGGSGEVEYVMAPNNDFPDVPATYQAQHGDDSANGIQMGGLVVTDATLEITRTEAKLSGNMLGLRWSTGVTLDGTATDVENVPVTPGSITAYLDSSFGSIGSTKLASLLSFRHEVKGRWLPEWVLDASEGSFKRLVECTPNPGTTLILEAGVVAMDLFATYRAGDTVYLRVTTGTHGPALGSTRYKMELDLPLMIKAPQEYKDEGGVYAIGWEFEPVADAEGAGFPMQLTCVNKVTAL